MVYVADLVGLLLKQRGDRYDLGHEVSANDADPDTFDCSELVEWGCARLGVTPTMPDGTWIQIRHCRKHGTEIPIDEAVATQGALLFRFSSDPFTGGRPDGAHVAVSLGNGSTIEARGRDWGVGSWDAERRGWTHAGLIPGVEYATPPNAPQPGGTPSDQPAWSGRYLTQPPAMSGTDVQQWQEQMAARGYAIDVDGEYGPDSEKACREFQAEAGLKVDGIVGPDTWQAAWTAPPQ